MNKKEDLTLALFSAIAVFLLLTFTNALIGSGTSGDPFQITNCIDLNQTRDDLAAFYVLNNNIDCSDTINWNGGFGFEPISTFTGSFDGKNFTITSLFINRSGDNNVGLFGIMNGGNISNVSLDDAYIRGNYYVGGLVGYSYNYATVDNAYFSGQVVGSNHVGGLVGYSKSGTIDNSYATGDVNSTGGDYTGGLVGRDQNTDINNSYANGTITSQANYVGGLVGYNYQAKIDNSYSTGSVKGNGKVGGLVGYNNYGTIDNSYATGNVNASGGNNAGGLVGLNKDSTINKSYANGTVSSPVNRVGGLVGQNSQSSISHSNSTGKVTGATYVGGLVGYNYQGDIDNSYSSSNVIGNSTVGGLVGYSRDYVIIDNSYATGDVNSTGGNNTGGLVGRNRDSTINNSYSTGNVNSSGDNVVGLLGHNYGPGTYSVVENSYAIGNVSGANNVGGLVGHTDNTNNINNNYWYNKTIDSAGACIAYDANQASATDCEGSTTADAGRVCTVTYFFDVNNVPLLNWTYTPWSTFCNISGYPTLSWHNLTNVSECRAFGAVVEECPTEEEAAATVSGGGGGGGGAAGGTSTGV